MPTQNGENNGVIAFTHGSHTHNHNVVLSQQMHSTQAQLLTAGVLMLTKPTGVSNGTHCSTIVRIHRRRDNVFMQWILLLSYRKGEHASVSDWEHKKQSHWFLLVSFRRQRGLTPLIDERPYTQQILPLSTNHETSGRNSQSCRHSSPLTQPMPWGSDASEAARRLVRLNNRYPHSDDLS